MFSNEENYKQMKSFFHVNLTQMFLSISSQFLSVLNFMVYLPVNMV